MSCLDSTVLNVREFPMLNTTGVLLVVPETIVIVSIITQAVQWAVVVVII